MRHAGVADCAAYLVLVSRDVAALDDLVDELRGRGDPLHAGPEQMELVRREVLPALEAPPAGRAPARVWSAGCATGEEGPNSLAILLAEEGLDRTRWCSAPTSPPSPSRRRARRRIRTGRCGRERPSSSTTTSAMSAGKQVLVDRVRNMVRFERLNLRRPAGYAAVGATGMDLILCRNVLMYFGEETAGRIAARLFDCLAEGGVLLTSGADLLLGEYAPFEVQVTRRGTHLPAPRAATAPCAPPPRRAARAGITAGRFRRALAGPRPRARGLFDRSSPSRTEWAPLKPRCWPRPRCGGSPLDAPLHYLRAALLVTLARDEDAEQEAERALYLDPSLAIAHFLLGTILRKRGARPGALRAFRNARDLCAARPADEAVPAGAGERVGALRSAAAAEMDLLEARIA